MAKEWMRFNLDQQNDQVVCVTMVVLVAAVTCSVSSKLSACMHANE